MRDLFEFSICYFFPLQTGSSGKNIFIPSMQLIVFLSKAHATNYYEKNVNTVSVYTLNSLNRLFVLFFLFGFCINTEIEKLEELMMNCQQNVPKLKCSDLNCWPPPPELPISRVDGSRHVRMQLSIKLTSIVLYLIDRRRKIDRDRLISV